MIKVTHKSIQWNRYIICFFLCACILISLGACASTRYERYRGTHHGVASWYGSDFHGKPTSSGEPFDMYKLTCAHRIFPFGTRLRVTNISNNKSVICVVNDRGPFIKGRDIDLSYAAANEIDLIAVGVGEVMIESEGRDISYVKVVKHETDIGTTTIQVGSFKDFTNAKRLQKALELRYSKVYIKETCIEGDTYFRVRVGKFSDSDQVDDFAKTLADEGYDVLITRYDEGI
jgi:rare lipoprotein A